MRCLAFFQPAIGGRPSSCQHLDRKNLVHRSRTVPIAVDGHVAKPRCLHHCRDRLQPARIERRRHLLFRNLNPRNRAMMAHAKTPVPQPTHPFFRVLNALQYLGGHTASILNARRQAGRRRLVPHPQPRLARQRPHIFLGQPRLSQGSNNPMLPCGPLPRTKILVVIQIQSVCDGGKITRIRLSLHHVEEFRLAVEATVRVVHYIRFMLQLARHHRAQRNSMLRRKALRVLAFAARQASGVGQHSNHAAAQNTARLVGQVCRVNAAGVGNHHAANLLQPLFQPPLFVFQTHAHISVLPRCNNRLNPAIADCARSHQMPCSSCTSPVPPSPPRWKRAQPTPSSPPYPWA